MMDGGGIKTNENRARYVAEHISNSKTVLLAQPVTHRIKPVIKLKKGGEQVLSNWRGLGGEWDDD